MYKRLWILFRQFLEKIWQLFLQHLVTLNANVIMVILNLMNLGTAKNQNLFNSLLTP